MSTPKRMLLYPGSFSGLPGISQDCPVALCDLAALNIALKLQDPYTREHARRVAGYAATMAQCLSLSAEDTATVCIGGLLHDIGKIAFSPDLLTNTRSRLTAAMRAEIRRHPEYGVSFLTAIHAAAPVVDCVRYHHERRDGSGYPHGLRDQEIPLCARIVSVADCFDALTTDRSYQKGKSAAEALRILERLGRTALSSELVRALKSAICCSGS